MLERADKVDVLHCNNIAFYSHQGQPETYDRLGQGNNLAPLQTDIL